MSVNGLFFPNRYLTPDGLGAFGAAAVSEGILDGGAVTVSGARATLAAAWISCGGRVLYASAGQYSLGGNYTVIYAKVDTTKTSTAESFSQAELGAVSVSALAEAYGIMSGANASYPASDVNMGGTVRYVWLALVSYLDSTPAVMAVNRARAASSGQKLWENPAPTALFAAQTLTLPQMAGYNAFLIVCRRNSTSELRSAMLCPAPDTSELGFSISASEAGSATYHRQRNVYIDRSAGTIRFSSGWLNGSGADNNYVLIPFEIYGLRLTGSIT